MPPCEGYRFGDFVLDVPQKRLQQGNGSVVELTPRVFAALLLLVERAGLLVERQALLDRVWPGLVVGENSLSQVIVTLRRTLGDDAQGSRFIQTVPRKGFRFIAPVAPVEGSGAPDGAEPPAPAVAPPAATASGAEPAMPSGAAQGSNVPRREVLAGAAALAALAAGAAAWWKWRAQPGAGEGSGVRLAVLPFRLLGDTDHEKLLEIGMADSLIGRLSTLPGLVVLSPASVGRFASGAHDPLQAAETLGADWVVDGSVQRVDDRLRVVARLSRAGDAVAAWSEVTDQKASSLFELQDRVATGIARALTDLVPAVGTGLRIELGGTRNVEAYQLYLAATWRAQGGRAADLARSLALLEQALAIDPDFAQAWAMLAWVHRRHLWIADTPPTEVFARSDAAVQRALTLVPDLALARAGKGFSRFWSAFDWAGAEDEFRAALKANPSETNAHWGLAFLFLTQGRLGEGFEHMRKARQLDPLWPVFHTLEASFLAAAGKHDDAHRRLQTALDISPGLWLTHAALGRLLIAEGRTEAGIAALRRAVELAPDTVRAKAHLATQLALHGQAAEARAILEQIRARARESYVPPTSLAMALAALGESAAALDELDRAYEVRDTRLVELTGDPSWSTLRGQPRFIALVRRLGMQDAGKGLASV
jgi:DNA-binding winged helix-turn-helix (wHTH) protein/TolB-like protein/Tfp pilus assembly protein PilF